MFSSFRASLSRLRCSRSTLSATDFESISIPNSEPDSRMSENPRIVPMGEGAVTVDFGNEISVPLNERVIALAHKLEKDPFPGLIEAVPAYASVSVFFDLVEVRRSFPESSSAYAAVSDLVDAAIQDLPVAAGNETQLIEIPVDFSDTSALDLATISQ